MVDTSASPVAVASRESAKGPGALRPGLICGF
jgi:hypothetical protein